MEKTEMCIRLVEQLLRNNPMKTAEEAAKDAKKAVEELLKD